MFFKKLFGSVSDKKDASKDIEDFQKQTTPNPTTTNTTTTTTPQEPKPQEQPSTTTTTTTTTDTPDISSTPTPKRELKQVEDISLEKLFERYLKISQEEDITSDAVTVSGLIKFAEDLGVDPQDIVMLIILYKIKSTRQYVLTKDQFVNGFRNLGCNNLKDIKALIPRLRSEFDQPRSNLFKEVYDFSFDYNKEPDQKSFACEDAVATWQLFFGSKYGHIDKWSDFVLTKYGRPIPRDVWKQFLNFVLDVGTNLSAYQDDGSWPSLIDDYVELVRAS